MVLDPMLPNDEADATENNLILIKIRNIDQQYQVYRDWPASPHI